MIHDKTKFNKDIETVQNQTTEKQLANQDTDSVVDVRPSRKTINIQKQLFTDGR